MHENDPEKFNENSVCLLITLDVYDHLWTHFQTSNGLVLTFQDLPNRLRQVLKPILLALLQRHIQTLDFHSHRPISTLVDQHPFELHLLGIDADFEELFDLISWWIRRNQQRNILHKDIHNRQPHTTWTCACGDVVAAEKELCKNTQCKTWMNYAKCTGKNLKKTLRLA